MKTKKYIVCSLLLAGMISSCSDTWDEHYNASESVVENTSITSVNESLTNYLAKEPALDAAYQLFKETGMIDKLQEKEQLYTILAVDGKGLKSTREASNDDIYTAQTYISDVSLSPSNITEGQRILMWSGKYLEVKKSEDETIRFNNATVTKIVKLNNGYLYILDEAIVAPRNMYEMIESLDDEYSIFRDMVISRNVLTFDKEHSVQTGVDQTGNSVYDSVFTVKAPYFENKGFNIMSENVTATMLIPSNDLINSAINTAKAKLKDWGLEREDSVLQNWILQSMFYDKKLTKEDFEATEDLKSVFGTQWRTTVQEVDLNNPISMSNGTAYHVTKMKIPTNVLIFRLKDYYRWYEYLTDTEKDTYYVTENLSYEKIRQSGLMTGLGWTQAGTDKYGNYLFPEISFYYTLSYKLTDLDTKSYDIKFTPFKYVQTSSTEHTTVAYKVPPGEYNLCLGFEQNKDSKLGEMDIYFNGELVTHLASSALTGSNYHYDRAGQGYPEGYDTAKAKAAGWSKSGNYDRDGTRVGNIVITGNEAQTVELRFVGSGSKLEYCWLHHWCLKPTSNCY